MDCIVCTDFTLLLLSIPTCMTAVCWHARLITTLTPHLFIIMYDASFCTFSLAGIQGQSDPPYAYRSLDRSGHLCIYIFPFSVYFNNQRTVYAQQRPLRSVRLHCDFSRSQLFLLALHTSLAVPPAPSQARSTSATDIFLQDGVLLPILHSLSVMPILRPLPVAIERRQQRP